MCLNYQKEGTTTTLFRPSTSSTHLLHVTTPIEPEPKLHLLPLGIRLIKYSTRPLISPSPVPPLSHQPSTIVSVLPPAQTDAGKEG